VAYANVCGAKKRQIPDPVPPGWNPNCTRPAGWGTPHVGTGTCKLHGGGTSSHRRKAAVEAAEAAAAKAAAGRTLFGQTLAERSVKNPLAAYAKYAGEVMAWSDCMRNLVEQLTTPGYRNDRTGEQIRAEVQLYERALDRCNQVLSAYARLNIDERLATIADKQREQVLLALEAGLAEAGVTGEAGIRAKRAAARYLRTLDDEEDEEA
jgi:hypothetical protein